MTNTFLFEGIVIPSQFTSVEALSFAWDEFLIRDDDVILVSYPRSGTHWMINILSLIISEGDLNWIQTVEHFIRSPAVESKDFQKVLVDQDGPCLMVTHLPIQFFPKSYFTSSAKLIYLIRNPKDIITSHYHISKLLPLMKTPENFDEHLNRFIQGNVPFGSWFDHVLGWIKRRDTMSFLLLSYEELQKDLRSSVQKICQYLGKNLDLKVIDSIVKNSSFTAMKNNRLSHYVTIRNYIDDTTTSLSMMRKGVSGDWKNLFTVAQSEAFDKVYHEKISSLDLGLFPWS